jgi:hypothetical protein
MPVGVYKHKKGYKRLPFSEEWKKNLRVPRIYGKKNNTKEQLLEFLAKK